MFRTATQIGHVLGLSFSAQSELLIAASKFAQAFFAATMDYYTYRLATKAYGVRSHAAYAALLLTALSPWQAFCSVRTLSNSIETTLTVVALCLWPWQWFVSESNTIEKESGAKSASSARASTVADSSSPSRSLYGALTAAALACILRPTNIIVWATVSSTLLIRHGDVARFLILAQAALLTGGAILAVSVSADRAFYESWILPPLRFLQFNLVQSLAVFYGRNRPDYYLTEGLPLLLTTALPFAAVGHWQALRRQSEHSERSIGFTLATAVLATVSALSLISHKEVRFIYPLLPMLHVLAAKPLAVFFSPSQGSSSYAKRMILCLLVGINVFIGWYTLFVHQRGVVDVLHYLRGRHEIVTLESGTGTITTAGFLMPCHSTPWRSHLIYPEIHAWALTCEPPLNLTMAQRETYMDEADVFYDNPQAWLKSNMGSHESHLRPWPEYLVFFEQLEETLSQYLRNVDTEKYEEAWRGFNTHWHDDRRRHGDVVVWRKSNGSMS